MVLDDEESQICSSDSEEDVQIDLPTPKKKTKKTQQTKDENKNWNSDYNKSLKKLKGLMTEEPLRIARKDISKIRLKAEQIEEYWRKAHLLHDELQKETARPKRGVKADKDYIPAKITSLNELYEQYYQMKKGQHFERVKEVKKDGKTGYKNVDMRLRKRNEISALEARINKRLTDAQIQFDIGRKGMAVIELASFLDRKLGRDLKTELLDTLSKYNVVKLDKACSFEDSLKAILGSEEEKPADEP